MSDETTTLFFDFGEIVAARRSDNPIQRELARLMCSPYNFDSADIAAVALALNDRSWKKPSEPIGQRGRPSKWTDDDKIHAWLQIEAEIRKAQQRDPNCGIQAAIHAKFVHLPRRERGVWRITSHGKYLEIDTPETARKYHREFEKIIERKKPLADGRFISEAQAAWLSYVADIVARIAPLPGKEIASK